MPVTAVRRPAHALRDMVRYWRAERVTLRQGFTALTISSAGDLLAGLALGAMTGQLQRIPGLLLLIPAAIGMRGNIFGAVGSRLGTSIHAGLFRVTREKSGVLYQNAYASMMLSIVTSMYLAVGARIMTAALGLPSSSVWDFVVISVLGGVFSSVVVLALTIVLARFSYARNWDMDSVSGPVVTFIGDTITLPALFLASLLAQRHYVTLVMAWVIAVFALVCLVMAFLTKLPVARRIIRESLFVLALTGAVNLLAGAVLEHRIHRLLALPALLVLLPSFLEDAGALGAIVSSRLASKLHLGAIRPRLIPERLAILDITLAAPFALSVFTLVGVSAHVVSRGLGIATPGLLKMVEVSLIAGYLATLGAAIIAYAGAVATFRFGLDPDNHAIPIVTSSLDLLGVVTLVGTVVLLGVK
ncbi:MAG: magnesium transporter [Actinomycetota bacterium]|nr:magnesium transporter [Actinomycetota bacterium]